MKGADISGESAGKDGSKGGKGGQEEGGGNRRNRSGVGDWGGEGEGESSVPREVLESILGGSVQKSVNTRRVWGDRSCAFSSLLLGDRVCRGLSVPRSLF